MSDWLSVLPYSVCQMSLVIASPLFLLKTFVGQGRPHQVLSLELFSGLHSELLLFSEAPDTDVYTRVLGPKVLDFISKLVLIADGEFQA